MHAQPAALAAGADAALSGEHSGAAPQRSEQRRAPTGCRENPWGAPGPTWVLGTGTWCWAAEGLLRQGWRGAARHSDLAEPTWSISLATSLPRNTPKFQVSGFAQRSPLKLPTGQHWRGRGCGRAAPRGRGGAAPGAPTRGKGAGSRQAQALFQPETRRMLLVCF